tara:strand:+ start:578 stop:820 length:243 start_codon:yes stop_codon:yes gene_type:complete
MTDKEKSQLVSRCCVQLIADLKANGLDDFETLSALILVICQTAKNMGIPKKIVGGVIFRLWDNLEDDDLKKYVFDFNIEA